MKLKLENIGQIRSADLDFADLTVFVGPQASGKSIALQLVKLILDSEFIKSEFLKVGHYWEHSLPDFLDLYLGKGMRGVWNKDSRMALDGKPVDAEKLVSDHGVPDIEKVFFAPAQRVMTFRDGWPRNFTDYQAGDPFVMRNFSESLRLMCDRMPDGASLSPLWQELNGIGDVLQKEIFAGYDLRLTREDLKRRFVLRSPKTEEGLTHMAWSTGQRELVPLLLAFQKILCPFAPKRNGTAKTRPLRGRAPMTLFQWVALEEIEMGLHPRGISAALLPVFSLLNKGKKVCLSTHASQVLDLLWALNLLRKKHAEPKRVLDIFRIPENQETLAWASGVLEKSLRVYYFDRDDGIVKDISELDPDAEDNGHSGWGGLTEFEGRVGNIVSEVMANG